MIIYHGSDHIIEKPVYRQGKPYNDYGYGFYCTEYEEMAAEWSVDAARNGYINSYIIATDKLKTLNLNSYSAMTWLAVLLENRTFDINTSLGREARKYILREFLIDYEKFDIITGYRADDSYFSFAQDFINGSISYEQLTRAMRLGKLGNQIVIKSPKAYQALKWIGAKEADRKIWFPKKEHRDKSARQRYTEMHKEEYVKGALYITKILDEEIKKDDARLR